MMETGAADLLRVLGSGVRPTSGDVGAGVPAAGASFADLLDQARAGQLETGLPVSIADGAGVSLTGEQLGRLAGAVDRAHAEGATRIVVLMDGLSLDVDVLGRSVLGTADLPDGKVLTGIDGVMRLGDAGTPTPSVLPLPSGLPQASVLKLLEGLPSAGEPTAA
ncbi:MAG: hypothetical protein IPJ41_14425 [Phycisphaerales bacterium]|nr:hypothetical protein [Phycisphaerales bacterium]